MLPPNANRIGWNLLPLRREALGGWLYTKALLEVAATHGNVSAVAFVTPESREMVEHLPSVEPVEVRVSSGVRPLRVLAEHARLPGLVRRHGVTCLHSFFATAPRLAGVVNAITVLDLHVFFQPKDYSLPKRWYLQRAVPPSLRRAAVVLPMSESTAADVQRYVGVDESRLMVIPPIIDDRWHPPTPDEVTALRVKFSLPETFWLYVASGYEYKNHEGLLQAMVRMRQGGVEPWPLVLRGPYLEPHLARAAELGLGNLVTSLPLLEQHEMRALYGAASACVMPSFFEGGGLPGMEAMACGAPLIASDIPTAREFLAGYAERFDPHDVGQIADAMVRMQKSHPERGALAALGTAQLRHMRPRAVAERLMAAYELALRGARTGEEAQYHPVSARA